MILLLTEGSCQRLSKSPSFANRGNESWRPEREGGGTMHTHPHGWCHEGPGRGHCCKSPLEAAVVLTPGSDGGLHGRDAQRDDVQRQTLSEALGHGYGPSSPRLRSAALQMRRMARDARSRVRRAGGQSVGCGGMSQVKAIIDKELCIRCELCASTCPDVYEIRTTGCRTCSSVPSRPTWRDASARVSASARWQPSPWLDGLARPE